MESLASLSSSSFFNHHALSKPTHRAFALKLHSPLCSIHDEDDQSRGGGTMPCPEERLENRVSRSPQKAILSSPSSSASGTVPVSDRRRWIPPAQRDIHSKDALIQAQKGSAFTLKLEEMLIALKNRESKKIGLRNNVIDPRKKFSDVKSKEEKNDLVESKPLLLNLFANSPNVPWDADKKYFYSTNLKPQLPIGRKRVLGRKSNRSSFDASKKGNGSLMNPDAYKGKRSPMNVITRPKNKVDDEKYELQESLAQRERRVTGRNKDLSNFDAYKGKKNVLVSANVDSTLENKNLNDGKKYGLQEFKDNMGKWEIDTRIENHADIEEGINFNWTDSDEEENGSSTPWITSDDEENASATNSCTTDDDLVARQGRQRSFDIQIDEKNSEVPHETHMPTSSSDKKPTWQEHNIPDLPFEFRYSYTEIPKAPILGYRERPYSPFGPISIRRPWTGGKPPNPTKKKVPEFDSFNPPPKNKKGVKFVQDPGPFNKGQGPKPAKSREEILGDPLSKEDIIYLVEKCQRENRQLNLGRDGLTHNMLDTIHCHWKRRRVCKIKCKGVPTVDMDNVCFQIEDKTGGKIIYRTGGVLFLFRGRNYNYKDRPKIPLMLWKPASPIYPKLIQDAPEELTKEEAYKLRVLGRKVEPICKIGKNGLYSTLIEDVRNAFKLDDLVRIDCQGLKPTDYKKIGAKLKDLVPCVLLSFRKEHILMWKGRGKVSTTNNESAHQDTDDSMPARSSSQSNDKSVLWTDDLVLTESCISSELSLYKVDAQGDGKGIERTRKVQDEDTKVYIESLWDHAIECGMAIELDKVDMDPESIVDKATKLAETAPIGPIYTHTLLKKLRVKTEWKEQGDEQVQVYFGRSRYVDRPNKRGVKKRSYQLPTLEVPPMGGLPVDELAKLLAV